VDLITTGILPVLGKVRTATYVLRLLNIMTIGEMSARDTVNVTQPVKDVGL